MSLLLRGKIVLPYAADRAHPIIGELFKGGSGSDTGIGVSNCRIVFVSADITYILSHIALI